VIKVGVLQDKDTYKMLAEYLTDTPNFNERKINHIVKLVTNFDHEPHNFTDIALTSGTLSKII